MKTLREIYQFLDSISPFESQESWDNSGILIGNPNNKIKHIFTSLEATNAVVKEIAEFVNVESCKDSPNSIKADFATNSLLITHHPLIFSPLKSLDFSHYPSNVIETLIKNNISLISLHTNFDVSHLNEFFTREILGFMDAKPYGFAYIAEVENDIESFVESIKLKLQKDSIKVSKAKNSVKKIAIVCGSGLGVINTLEITQDSPLYGLDCIITGDIKYHDAIKFQSLGISLIDAGHYESEYCFTKILEKNLKKIEYNAIILDSKNPFIQM